MAQRIYYAPLHNLSVTNDADQDIWEIVAPATKKVVLHGFSLTSAYATDERANLRLVSRTTTGSGGTGATESPSDADNAVAAGAAVSTLVTAPGTLGVVYAGFFWSQQGELLWLPTPDLRVVSSASGRLALNLNAALGGTRQWSGWVAWEEV